VSAIAPGDADAQRAYACLTAALSAIRKEKTEQKVSVGTEVLDVTYRAGADDIRCLKLVERDLKAAARTEALTLVDTENPEDVGARVTLKPAEVS
jgi:hypothetical protein